MPRSKEPKGRTNAAVHELMMQQASPKEIAEKLGLSLSTVHYHVTKIMKEKKKEKRDVKRSQGRQNGHAQGYTEADVQIAYLSGGIEQIVRGYAESHRVSFGAVAAGVAKHLHAAARG